jgi:hypothetical protein
VSEKITVHLASQSSKPIPLAKALWILSKAHTRDDEQGFVVEMLADVRHGPITQSDYIEAWRSVRYNIGQQTQDASEGDYVSFSPTLSRKNDR